MWVAAGGAVLGMAAIADEPRLGSADAVTALQRMGLRCAMLTGAHHEPKHVPSSSSRSPERRSGVMAAAHLSAASNAGVANAHTHDQGHSAEWRPASCKGRFAEAKWFLGVHAGDNAGAAAAVAAAVGLVPADVRAGLLPADKLALVRLQLQTAASDKAEETSQVGMGVKGDG